MYQVQVIADQVFSMAGGRPRLADLYLPKGMRGPAPVILWVHGGGFRFGDRKLAPDLERWFAQRGFAMVSFDYRLSDEVKFPAPVIDVKTAIRWVRSIAPQYALDPDAIGLWGSSAGGHLSAIAALSDEKEFVSDEHAGFSSAVHAVVDGYGPTDFSRIDEDRIAVPPKVPDAETVVVKNVLPASHPDSFESRLLGVAAVKGAPEVKEADPATYARPGAPPFLILHGESDSLVPWTQSQLLFEAVERAGNHATFVRFERLGHGFFNNSDLDETEIGPSLTRVAGALGPASETQRSVCFSLCEQFFRTHLAGRFLEPLGASSAPVP